MTNDEMTRDFLAWEQDSPKKPTIEDVPASQLDVMPIPPESEDGPVKKRADEKPAPKFVMPERKEPVIQTPDVTAPDVEVPLHASPETVLPEFKLELLTTEEYRELFNNTVPQIAPLEPEEIQKLKHSMARKIEMAKVQMQCMAMTYEGKIRFIDEKRRQKLKEADSAFYIPRREKGAARATGRAGGKGNGEDKSSMSKFEKGIEQFVKMHMTEPIIRQTLASMGTTIPENLTAIISAVKLRLGKA